MADVAQAFTKPASNILTVTWSGIDADTDTCTAAMILLLHNEITVRGRPPNRVTVSVDRVAGAAAIDIDLQGSVRNDGDWKQVFNETTPDTPEGVDLATHAYEFWRMYVTTVGAGNTLAIVASFVWDI